MLIGRRHYRRGAVAVAAVAVAAGMAFSAAPAMADDAPEAPSYVLAAWIVADPSDIWATPQTLSTSIVTTDPSLDQLDGDLPCGLDFQIDRYVPGDVTDALLAGGILYGPSNPAEALAYLDDGNPWKYLHTADCVGEPPVVVEPPVVEPPVIQPPAVVVEPVAAPVVAAVPTLAETGPNDVVLVLGIAAVLLAAGATLIGIRYWKYGHQQ